MGLNTCLNPVAPLLAIFKAKFTQFALHLICIKISKISITINITINFSKLNLEICASGKPR